MSSSKHQDPWHFSHLGEEFFKRIAFQVRASNIRDAKIEDLYLGCTGVEYIEKKNGRLVNPNWCIRLKDGAEFKFGMPIRNALKPGLWDLAHCLHYKWSDVVDYYNN